MSWHKQCDRCKTFIDGGVKVKFEWTWDRVKSRDLCVSCADDCFKMITTSPEQTPPKRSWWRR